MEEKHRKNLENLEEARAREREWSVKVKKQN